MLLHQRIWTDTKRENKQKHTSPNTSKTWRPAHSAEFAGLHQIVKKMFCVRFSVLVFILCLCGCQWLQPSSPITVARVEPDMTVSEAWFMTQSVFPTATEKYGIGSSFCIGNDMFLSAGHVIPFDARFGDDAALVIGRHVVYPTVIAAGDRGILGSTSKDDWVLFRAKLDKRPRLLPYDSVREIPIGEDVFLFGYPSRHLAAPENSEGFTEITPKEIAEVPMRILAGRVVRTPNVSRTLKDGRIIWAKIHESLVDSRQLSGMSGGPACVRDNTGRLVAIGILSAFGHGENGSYYMILRPDISGYVALPDSQKNDVGNSAVSASTLADK